MSEEIKNENTEVEEVETETVNPSEVDVNTNETESSSTETESNEEGKSIPYSRFKSKVDEVNKLKAELDELKNGSIQQDEAETVEEVDADETKTVDYKELSEQYKQAFEEVLQSKLEQVPDDMRDLIPDVDELQKLKWIDNAIAKGLFTTQKPQDFGNLGANPTEEEAPDTSSFIRGLGRKFS